MVVVYILKLIEKNWEKIGGVRLEIGNKLARGPFVAVISKKLKCTRYSTTLKVVRLI